MVEQGQKVRVHYEGALDDGSVFDSSKDRDPMEFEVGAGQVIAGFDEAVRSMTAGETKTVKIPCEKAYGNPRDELVGKVPKDNLPDGLNTDVGTVLQMTTPQGAIPVRVTAEDDASITVDANHPLAGKDLTFTLTLVGVVGDEAEGGSPAVAE
jgi:peptidylprolyl isomerase